MTNLILLLVFVACIGTGAAWIAENPGQVTIHWFDYRIDTSFAVLLLLAVIAALILAQCYVLLRRLLNFPVGFMQRRNLRHYRDGLTELTYSVAALATSDFTTAEAHTRKAEKLLGTPPLTLLLAAQISRNQGNEAKTQGLLEQMLSHKETEYLAARSLSEAASKQRLFPKALALAERARTVNPRERESAASVISLNVKLGKWQEALQALEQSARKTGLSKAQRTRMRGVILLAHGLELLEKGDDEAALSHAKAALKSLPDFVPAICFAARAYTENARPATAKKLLLRAWERAPHPQISDTLRAVTEYDPPEKRQKIMQKVASPLLDSGRLWRCIECGQAEAAWHVHCPSCSGFDTLE